MEKVQLLVASYENLWPPSHISTENAWSHAYLAYILIYLEDFLVLAESNLIDHLVHLSNLDLLLEQLNMSGLKVNVTKSPFTNDRINY